MYWMSRSRYSASLSISLEVVISLSPFFGQCISLSLHTALCKHQILRNGYMQVPENVQCHCLICCCQVLVYNGEWLNLASIEVLPPGHFICHDPLHLVINRLEVKDEFPWRRLVKCRPLIQLDLFDLPI